MALYKLNYSKEDLSDGYMEKANKEAIDYERDFENWLENSPHVLFEDIDSSTIMWIGRQISASYADSTKYPDLMGIDSNGDVVIVELKKGKTPREVVAQVLEYAAWANRLTYDDLNSITMKYYDKKDSYKGMELLEIHKEIFNPENEFDVTMSFNNKLRLYIVAEEISRSVKDVVRYLNTQGNIDITSLKYDVFRAGDGQYYISTEVDESESVQSVARRDMKNATGWNGNTPVKEIVKLAVDKVIHGQPDAMFSPKEIIEVISKQYSECNETTVRCQITADCVNHTSRRHYKGGQMDYYYKISKGKFRLYNPETDGQWNSDGEKVN